MFRTKLFPSPYTCAIISIRYTPPDRKMSALLGTRHFDETTNHGKINGDETRSVSWVGLLVWPLRIQPNNGRRVHGTDDTLEIAPIDL
jgi:hypothetical protein